MKLLSRLLFRDDFLSPAELLVGLVLVAFGVVGLFGHRQVAVDLVVEAVFTWKRRKSGYAIYALVG